MNWRGAWSSATAYSVNDTVSYGGGTYICIQAHTNQAPSTATAYWSLVAAQGAAGATGPTGVSGYAADATTLNVGAVLINRAAGGTHPIAVTTDDINAASGVAGLDSSSRLSIIAGSPMDFGNDYVTGAPIDGNDMGLLCGRAISVTGGRMRTDANPGQTLTATLLKNGVSVGTIVKATNGTVTTTGLPQSMVAGDRLIVSLSGTSGVTGLAYVFVARAD